MKDLLLILALLLSTSAIGQKEAEKWFFGQWAGLDFSCSPPQVLRSGMYYVQEGASTISDSEGNLLFYTNGDSVYTKEHQMMINGFNIGQRSSCWGSSTQGALIVPQPNSNDIYYIFVADCADIGPTTGLTYSVVDMSMNNGLGEVVSKAQPLHNPSTEKLAAVQHANGQDYWVLSHEHGTDAFMAYLVSESGLDTVPIISNEGHVQFLPTFSESMKRGYMKFSPNGEKVFVVTASDQHYYALYPEMFSFDNNTGAVTLDYTVEDPDSVRYYGATFSPDNNLLYLSGGWYDAVIHQFDANATNSEGFLASKQVIFPQDEPATYGPCAMQIGPDGKVYIATPLWWLDVIHSPNSAGQDCDLELQSVWLEDCPPTYSNIGLQNLPENFFSSSYQGEQCSDAIMADFMYTDTCFGQVTSFEDLSTIFPEEIGSWEWDFGDPASGMNNLSSVQQPTHTFTNPGLYNVSLTVTDSYGTPCKIATIEKEISIDICASLDDILNGASFQISPNPFADILELRLSEPSELEIYSTSGKLVASLGLFDSGISQIQLGSEIANGMWLLRVSNSEMSVFEKVVRVK